MFYRIREEKLLPYVNLKYSDIQIILFFTKSVADFEVWHCNIVNFVHSWWEDGSEIHLLTAWLSQTPCTNCPSHHSTYKLTESRKKLWGSWPRQEIALSCFGKSEKENKIGIRPCIWDSCILYFTYIYLCMQEYFTKTPVYRYILVHFCKLCGP